MTHAFFKACLFLGSGSVIHALGGEQDIRKMGGLWRKIPMTAWTFLIATLAIAGAPFLAGFFSKDAILSGVFEGHFAQAPWLPKFLWAVALLTAGLTAFYMFRLVSLTFAGRFRGTEEQEAHIHESPKTMTVPLIILAVLSVLGGYVGIPLLHGGNKIGEFLSPILLPLSGREAEAHHPAVSLELVLMAASVAVATAGALLALLWYTKEEGKVPAKIAARWPGVYHAVSSKYFVDEAYDGVFVEGIGKGGGRLMWDFDATVVDLIPNGSAAVTRGSSWISSLFDQYIVDGLVNGVADTLQAGYRLSKRAQTGRVQNYALVMGGGLFCLVAVYLIFR
jgi:NADH-quinone oxidoreductase subunit L